MILLHKKTSSYFLVLLMSLAILIVPSCSKDNNEDPPVYETYVSHELVVTYTSGGIKTLFQQAQILNPEIEALIEHIQYNVSVYNVTYKTPFNGEVIEASGLVCIPVSEGETFPIISFQNGTNTAHNEAPTKDYNSFFFKYLESSASMGYIMLIPDYIGFGKSEQLVHPYMHKESTVTSVENLILATEEMIELNTINANWNKEAYLMGYSQGGWATLCTHRYLTQKQEQSFEVKASSCGAGPYELAVVQNYMFEGVTYPQPVYMAYTGISYKSMGLITNPLTDYFNEPYATPLPSYFDGSKSNGEINELLNDTVSVLVANSFLTGINTDPLYNDFRNALESNSVEGWNTSQPIHLYHGTVDNYVPPTTTEIVYQEFKDAGAADMVSYFPLENMGHTSGAIPMVVSSLIWFNEIK